MFVLGCFGSYACNTSFIIKTTPIIRREKFITENNDSHGHADENTDNTAIDTFFRQSKVVEMEFQTFRTSFSAIFRVNPTRRPVSIFSFHLLNR
jgi:hypothetical protein